MAKLLDIYLTIELADDADEQDVDALRALDGTNDIPVGLYAPPYNDEDRLVWLNLSGLISDSDTLEYAHVTGIEYFDE